MVDHTASGWGYRSALFHGEAAFRERSRLRTLPPTVFTYELRAGGQVLAGTDALADVRAVTARNLDRRNTNEIVMKRLWALLEAIPAAWVRGKALDPIETASTAVACARNALDIPTVLLPRAGVLAPTYATKVQAWADLADFPPRDALNAALEADSAAYFRAQLARRRDPLGPANLIDAHLLSVRALLGALGWILRDAGAAGDAIEEVAAGSHSVFRETPNSFGQARAIASSLAPLAGESSLGEALAWLMGPRKGRICAAAARLHLALVHWHADDAGAALAQLERVPDALRAPFAAPPPPTGPSDFVDSWLLHRAWVGRAFWQTIRLGDPAARRRMSAALGVAW
jgi:hypothetical protein